MYALLIVIALIVCGSLYPWHFAPSHLNPWLVLMRSWPSEWTTYTMSDASANIVVYLPLGAIAFLSLERRYSRRVAAAAAISIALLLSLSMEWLQVYVPGRTSSLFDLACNVTGAALGALAARRLRGGASLFGRHPLPPVLLLGCWACYHLYPFVPMVVFSRTRFELMLWLHPPSFSFIETWAYTAEWLAAGVAVRRLFGPVGLKWLPPVLAFHFVARPFVAARPLVLAEMLGIILSALIWKTLPERLQSSPWLLMSAVLLRECAPLVGTVVPPFSWIPFRVLLAFARGDAVRLLARAMFDYTAILWLWRNRGMSYRRSGAILAGVLAVLAVMEGYGYLPGDLLSMADPALALLAALILGFSTDEIRGARYKASPPCRPAH